LTKNFHELVAKRGKGGGRKAIRKEKVKETSIGGERLFPEATAETKALLRRVKMRKTRQQGVLVELQQRIGFVDVRSQ